METPKTRNHKIASVKRKHNKQHIKQQLKSLKRKSLKIAENSTHGVHKKCVPKTKATRRATHTYYTATKEKQNILIDRTRTSVCIKVADGKQALLEIHKL